MKILGAEEFLAKRDLRTMDVPLPEFGEDAGVRIRAFTAKEAAEYSEYTRIHKTTAPVKIIVMVCVDENGNQVFTEKQINDLMLTDFSIIVKLQEAIVLHNGLDKEAKVRAEAAKNA